MPRAGQEETINFMEQLFDLVGDESTLRTLSKIVMIVFPHQRQIREIWNLLPTTYVTIPLQGVLSLGDHQKKHGKPETREEKQTQLTQLMLAFCKERELSFIRKTTFNDALNPKDIPRFSKLPGTELFMLVDLSAKALQFFIYAKEVKQQLKEIRAAMSRRTSHAHPVEIAEL